MLNTVYRKILELGGDYVNPRPMIHFSSLHSQLNIAPDMLRRALEQLQERRLIKYCGSDKTCIRLTLLGAQIPAGNPIS